MAEKFPPDDWSLDQKVDWLIHTLGNHMKSHMRMAALGVTSLTAIIITLITLLR